MYGMSAEKIKELVKSYKNNENYLIEFQVNKRGDIHLGFAAENIKNEIPAFHKMKVAPFFSFVKKFVFHFFNLYFINN